MSKDLGTARYEAKESIIAFAKERQADCADPADAEAYRQLADAVGELPMDWDEFFVWVRRDRPEYAHTLEWDECPDDWQQECYCSTCLSYMAEDG